MKGTAGGEVSPLFFYFDAGADMLDDVQSLFDLTGVVIHRNENSN